MRNNLLTIALLSLIGCGNESDSENANNAKEKEKVTLQSIALKTKDDLPKCSKGNETQLAYIRDEKQFYVCESSDWVAIDGPSEAKTVAGKDGANGDDGETVTTNNWYDAVTGKLWLIGASVHLIHANCNAPWRLPTKAEALAAAQRGLGVAASTINGPTSMWTSTPYIPSSGAGSTTIIINIATMPTDDEHINASGTFRGLFCVED